MYSKQITERDVATIESGYRLLHPDLPPLTLTHYSVAQSRKGVEILNEILNEDGSTTRRAFTPSEQGFIDNEMLLCSVDFVYWFLRYCFIELDVITGGIGLPGRRSNPDEMWESQSLILNHVAKAEEEMWASYEDQVNRGYTEEMIRVYGIRLLLHKARQLGATTLIQAMVMHRYVFQRNILGVTASHEPEMTQKVFDKAVRIYNNLPYWMKPRLGSKRAEMGMTFPELDNHYVQQDSRQQSGMSQGSTTTIAHLTELSKWDPKNIKEHLHNHLYKSMPYTLRTFIVEESTANGVGNHFHNRVKLLIENPGHDGWHYVFIPWFIEKSKYRLPAPNGWVPGPEVTAHARRVRETSTRWVGYEYVLDRDQMYFWEQGYRAALIEDTLADFLTNYPAEPEESFQASEDMVFTPKALMRFSSTAFQPRMIGDKGPPWEWVDGKPVPADMSMAYEDPRGIIWIFEKPLANAEYIIGVDTARGIVNWSRFTRTTSDKKKDNSVISVWRLGERGEPDVQVAEFAAPIPGEDAAEIGNWLGRLFKGRGDEFCMQIIETYPAEAGIAYQRRLYDEFGYWNLWRRVNTGTNQYARDFGWEANVRTRQDLWARTTRHFAYIDERRNKDTEYGTMKARLGGRVKAVIQSPWLVDEFRTCEPDPGKAAAKAAEGFHDDRVRAAQLAIFGGRDWAIETDEDAKDKQKADDVDKGKAGQDYRNTAVTAAEMVRMMNDRLNARFDDYY